MATQSKFLAVGSVVPWAEPQVGAIATQSYANPRYGPDGLALLREGLSAEEVVERLTEADDGRDAAPARHRRRPGRRGDVTPGSDATTGPADARATATRRRATSSSPRETVDALAETFEATAGNRSPSG